MQVNRSLFDWNLKFELDNGTNDKFMKWFLAGYNCELGMLADKTKVPAEGGFLGKFYQHLTKKGEIYYF